MELTAIPLIGRRVFWLLSAAVALAPTGRCAAAGATRVPPAASPPAASAPAAPAVAAPATTTPEPTPEAEIYLPTVEEVKLGREGAAEAEKEYKLVQDEAQLQRLRRIGGELIRAANDPEVVHAYPEAYKLPEKAKKSKRVPFQWSYKIVKSREVNAFSLAPSRAFGGSAASFLALPPPSTT